MCNLNVYGFDFIDLNCNTSMGHSNHDFPEALPRVEIVESRRRFSEVERLPNDWFQRYVLLL